MILFEYRRLNVDALQAYSSVEEIRFLPNSRKTFPNYSDFYCFLTQTMAKRNGRYNYPGLAMRCRRNTLVFFQYGGELAASAILLETVRGKCYDEIGNEYAGCYYFDMSTMVIYNPPITREQIKAIDHSFHGFNQCKQKVDLSLKENLLDMIMHNGYSVVSPDQ